MALPSSSNLPPFNYTPNLIPIFNGEAYNYWSTQMKILFISQDLWDVIEDGIKVPASQEELAKWTEEKQKEYGKNKQRDAKALLSILQGVSKDIYPRIMNATSAKKAWEILKNVFGGGDKEITKITMVKILKKEEDLLTMVGGETKKKKKALRPLRLKPKQKSTSQGQEKEEATSGL